MSEITEKVLKDRIKVLEVELEKVIVQIDKATQISISMQGGLIELKKLLEALEANKKLEVKKELEAKREQEKTRLEKRK